jgi:hypothetical protein
VILDGDRDILHLCGDPRWKVVENCLDCAFECRSIHQGIVQRTRESSIVHDEAQRVRIQEASVAPERPKRSGVSSDPSPTTKRSEKWAILGSNQ